MSTFYASKIEAVAANGEAHNTAMRKRYPKYEDQLRVLNLNIRLALVGDAQVLHRHDKIGRWDRFVVFHFVVNAV